MTIDTSPALATGWRLSDDGTALEKEFRFGSFPEALSFMLRAGFAAERLNHHPEWRNVYNRVDVRLTTHDTGGLTEKDLALAAEMDTLS